MSPHLRSVLQALLVTFLWSTSFVLIKQGLQDIPALTFAGLRYFIAFLCLLPLAVRISHQAAIQPSRQDWRWLLLLGFLMYTFTQGAQFLALQYLPAATVSLMLNFTSIIVLTMGIFWLSEYPTRQQLFGLVVFLCGVILYFYPAELPRSQWLGLGIAAVQIFSNAGSAVVGRHINRTAHLPVIIVTTISMGMGAAVLLVTGLIFQGLPTLNFQSIAIIAWLAVVNTAFAFTLWNYTLRTLSAMESSLINSTMLIQIGLLAWVFLDEALSLQALGGMILAAVGIILVQLRRRA